MLTTFGIRHVQVIKRRAERLQGETPIPSEWLHPETKHREPLGRYLEDVDNAERLRFMQDSSALTEFVTRRITPLLGLEDRVDRALTTSLAALCGRVRDVAGIARHRS